MVRSIKILLATTASLLAAQVNLARADISEGIAAYDGGDLDSAFAVFLGAAQAGDPEAQVALASLYQFGEGVPRNSLRAATWYRHAAGEGDPVAAANLGALYAVGEGVPRDMTEAYVWFSIAAAGGNGWAEAERARAEILLTSEDRERAADLIDERQQAEEPPLELSGEAAVLDGQTLTIDGRTLRLEGIVAPPLGHRCQLRGTMRDCGLISGTGLKDLTAGAVVQCISRRELAPDGVRYARCSADGYDLSEGMVYTGWARADLAQTDRYEGFEAGARAKKRGMWRTD
jgi:endonuclease YncB( thermonuclease family)